MQKSCTAPIDHFHFQNVLVCILKVQPLTLKVLFSCLENMDLPDLNYTPPAEDEDEMDEDVGDAIVQHAGK